MAETITMKSSGMVARSPESKCRFLTPVDRNNLVSSTIFPSQFSLDV